MPMGRHFARLSPLARPAICLAVLLAWLAGWSFADATWWSAWLHFIPAPAAVLAGCLAGYRNPRLPPGFRTVAGGITVLATLQLLAGDFRWHHPPEREGTIRLVQWNTARRSSRVDRLFEVLRKDQPDICVLSEAPRGADLAALAKRELGLGELLVDQGMALLSRYPLQFRGTIPVRTGRGWHARLTTPGGELDILLFDVVSHPSLDRSLPMQDLVDWIDRRRSRQPLLVVGDFNTTRDAQSLDPLRTRLRNSYEEAGRGWPYSWPMPVPLYAIDHCWHTPGVETVSSRYRWSLLSDHRRQVVDLQLKHSRFSNPGRRVP